MDTKEQAIKPHTIILSQLNTNLHRFIHIAEVDRAVLFGLLAKFWGLAAGPVTALLIATKFTPELQGYYYTFASLLALQVFVEMGLGTVIIQFASHEWSKLSLDKTGQILGSPVALSRLVSLAKIAMKWYLIASVIGAFGLGIGGYFFFLHKTAIAVNWVAPWLMLCLLTGITICLVPVWSLIEGCNQVGNVYTYRFIQGLFTSLSIWLAILLGAKLWTASVSSVVGLICAITFLRSRYRQFLKVLLFSRPTGSRIGWRLEMLPMQWRIALSWISGYFTFSLFTPVLFHHHGAIVAGQMGMTLALVSAISGIASTWVYTKAPRFGLLIARREYAALDRLFFRVTIVSFSVAACGAIVVWVLVYLLFAFNHPLSARLLPPLPTGLLLLAIVLMQISFPQSTYLRAHKKEPFLVLSVVGSLMIGLSTWLLGGRFGAIGIAAVFLAVRLFFNIPFGTLIWYRCRSAWHKDSNK